MTTTISIEGMMCAHCQAHVEKALKEVAGVTEVTVSLENKNAVVTGDASVEALKQQPALLLDLHEAHEASDNGADALGNSLICDASGETGELIWGMLLASENGTLCASPLTLYGSPPHGSINRTVSELLGIPVITVETLRTEALAQRVRNQLEIVQYVLQAKNML